MILLATVQFESGLQQFTTSGVSYSSGFRQPTLTIKLVFLGINATQIDQPYLTSDLNVPKVKYQSVLQGSVNTGVQFNFNYQTVFANTSVVSNFVSYLGSGIQEVHDRLALSTPYTFNPYFNNATSDIRYVQNTFYNASRVENYFASNLDLYGTAPVPGYTLFIADLHNFPGVPSFTYTQYQQDRRQINSPCSPNCTATVHYYNRTTTDLDLQEPQTRHYMTAWGGNYRFYYIDMSAGPSYWTGDLPIQVASGVNNVTLTSPYARTWTTEVVADYVSGAVMNLFAADVLYPVTYSRQYSFHLFAFDNRTAAERALGPAMDKTVNTTRIQTALAGLMPFATVTVDAKFLRTDDYPDLAKVIHDSAGLIDPNIHHHVVDARPVYEWLRTGGNGQGNIKKWITVQTDTTKIDIPAFVFAFKGDYNFGFTGKGDVFMPASHNHGSVDSIFGVALPDMVLASHGEYNLNTNAQAILNHDVGVGFTATLTHEFGHMMGLNHPFIYDSTEDFTDTVMAYYSASTQYSQFDHDTILRGISDALLGFAQSELSATSANLFNAGQIANANSAISRANQKYDKMDYKGAVQDSVDAATNAQAANNLSAFGLSPSLLSGILGLAVGVAIGFLIGYLFLQQRQGRGASSGSQMQYGRCPTCGRPLRWDPLMMQWYCDNCKHFVKQ